jgi:hypothetical protein
MSDPSSLTTNLQIATYTVGIATAIVAVVRFLLKARRESIDSLRRDLARPWTNEGDISSEETAFVNLDICLKDGELFGTLASPREERLLSAHVDVHWGFAVLRISRLMGRSQLLVSKVRLRLKGNRNRVHWKSILDRSEGLLPQRTVLWPSVIANQISTQS